MSLQKARMPHPCIAARVEKWGGSVGTSASSVARKLHESQAPGEERHRAFPCCRNRVSFRPPMQLCLAEQQGMQPGWVAESRMRNLIHHTLPDTVSISFSSARLKNNISIQLLLMEAARTALPGGRGCGRLPFLPESAASWRLLLRGDAVCAGTP